MDTIIHRTQGNSSNIHINRPNTLNSLSNDMVNKIRQHLNQGDALIFTGEGRSFCAGGDVVSLVNGQTRPTDFFSNEFRLFYEISLLPKPTISVLDGITMGGGVGLSMACKSRILTNKTLWAMPETAIGFFPDVGASFFLNNLKSQELGLYLALTGSRLSGADCYFAGISDYYAEILTQSQLNIIFEKGVSGFSEITKTPDSLKSEILRDLPMISQCFDCGLSVEGILQRLNGVNNEWSKRVLQSLSEMCPVSLRIAKELNRVGKGLSYFEALELEYSLCVKVCEIDNFNFANSITEKLINKKKGRVEWRPDSLAEVSDGYIRGLFEGQSYKLYSPNL